MNDNGLQGGKEMFLEIKDLKKGFGSGDSRTEVLRGIDFSVEKGEFCVLLGPSGSGKSTLLNIIGGIDEPDEGYISIDGEKTGDMKEKALTLYRRKHLGYVFQMYNLIPNLNVKENITLPILLDGKVVDEAYLNELIETLDLQNRVNHLPNELSGGQQQRVSIGRALMNHPAILLADEPTGNLDSKASRDIVELLKLSNKKYKQTIIMITHDHNLALNADRIITIDDGKIVSDEVVK